MTGPLPASVARLPTHSVWLLAAAMAIGALALDQATKWVIVSFVMDPPRIITVLPFFNLMLGFNRGVSFGFLGGVFANSPWILVLISSAIVALMLIFLIRSPGTLEAIGIGSIIGGALGNMLDRMRLGAVVDFLDLHAAGWHWPAFNTADITITVGAAALMLSGLRARPTATPRSS